MIDFRAGDLVYWLHRSGDKALCTVNEIHGDDRMWVTWHSDGFVNLMPTKGFVLANGEENDKV